MNAIRILVVLLTFLGMESLQGQEKRKDRTNSEKRMYIGTYTKVEGHVDGKAEGIYLMYREPESGSIRLEGTAAKIVNPSFVKESLDGRNLYAVSELGEKDATSGFLYSYKILADDSLEQIGKISTKGFAPCHIAIDSTGDYIFVSNYLGGVVAVYKRNPAGAAVLIQTMEFTSGSHLHSVTFSSHNKQFYVTDLGNDMIWIYNFDATGEISSHSQPFVELEEGAGPRHFTFSKDESFAYSINELNSSVNVYRVLTDGGLEIIQTISSLPKGFSGSNSAADIHLHPSGNFLYASNRGHNSIVAYKVTEGKLNLLEFISTYGSTPRNFAIDPTGSYLYVANQDSDNITSFRIDLNSGKLEREQDAVKVMTPVCIEL